MTEETIMVEKTVFRCDYCGKTITDYSWRTVTIREGRVMHFHDMYRGENIKTCFEEHEEIEKNIALEKLNARIVKQNEKFTDYKIGDKLIFQKENQIEFGQDFSFYYDIPSDVTFTIYDICRREKDILIFARGKGHGEKENYGNGGICFYTDLDGNLEVKKTKGERK